MAHETWQIDGKSLIELKSGEKVSWMNIADEATGAHLKAFVTNTRIVEEMNPSQTVQKINKIFKRWGLPKRIKIDNGRPFVNPNSREIPTKSILWWIGLGIKVIQNRPRCPQQNGIVEALQGTMSSWTNPGGQLNEEALQQRLDEESDFQRNHYKILARNRKTRIELYPELEKNERSYVPEDFDMKLVFNYLSLKVFSRIVKGSNGIIKFFGEYYYMGRKFLGERIVITFDPIERQWIFRDKDGMLLKTSTKGIPSEEKIKAFAI